MPPSWIVEFTKFYWLRVSEGPRRMFVPNFIKIGHSIASILRFANFQNGRRRHLGFSKSLIFICCRYLEGPDASLYQFFSKSVVPLRRYCDFSNFQGGRRRLGFFKSRNFTHYSGPELRDASACQTLLKSVKLLRRYKDFSIFQNTGSCHLGFSKS